jgi:hypothetical protein
MNIIYTISAYMIASSLIMISYVWFRYVKHTHSADYNLSEEGDNFSEESYYSKESIAA